MLTRIISGIIGVVALVAVLVFLPAVATEIAVALVAALALYEFYSVVLGKKELPEKIMLVIVGFAVGFAVMFVPLTYIFPVIVFGSILTLIILVLRYGKISFKECAMAFFGSIYVFALLRHVYMVRNLENGKFLVFAIFIGAFITDTGAYFTGCFLGKHKLAPVLSPKKTIEGSVGGILATVLAFFAYSWVGCGLLGCEMNVLNLILTAVLLSVVSQFGDLGASAIKREMGIKDYGNIMPGHGGALDRFDSVLFVAPAFYWLNEILPVFVIK